MSSFQEAIRLDPTLFEAYYGLAMLEQDNGPRERVLAAARKAVSLAPNDVARTAAQGGWVGVPDALRDVTPGDGRPG